MRKRGLACLLTTTMVLGMLLGVPATGKKAEAAAVTVGGYTVTGGSNGTDYEFTGTSGTDGELVIKTGTELTISTGGVNTTDRIVINTGVDANITLSNVVMKDFATSGYRGTPGIAIADNSNGNVKIYLAGFNDIRCRNAPAIQKNGTQGSLTIADAENVTGVGGLQVYTTGVNNYVGCAAIGGSGGNSSGNIIIESGIVNAVSTSAGAAIGGGSNGDGTDIKIKGGTVNAYVLNASSSVFYQGAGIGGGYNGDGNNIMIEDGIVNAKVFGAGVTATLEYNNAVKWSANTQSCRGGAGIGGGYSTSSTGGNADNIQINGGTITALGGSGEYNSAGIGAGGCGNVNDIVIRGGNVTTTGGGNYGTGIGTGHSSSDKIWSDVLIEGGTIVATGGAAAPAIGTGYNSNINVVITGGSIQATPGSNASLATYSDAIGLGGMCKYNGSVKCNVVSNESEINESSGARTIDVYSDKVSCPANTNMSGKLAFTKNGAKYDYGTKDMVSDAEGKVYLWLPEGVEVSIENSDSDPALVVQYNNSTEQQEWYGDTVSVTADGYKISDNENGPYSDSYSITSTCTNKTLYFLGKEGNTKATETVSVKIDKTAPTGKITVGNGSVAFDSLNTDTAKRTVYYTSSNQRSVALADLQDTESGLAAKAYYKICTSVLTSGDAIENAGVKWTQFSPTSSQTFTISTDENWALYVKLVDAVGNTRYLSTPLYYCDTTAVTVTAGAEQVSKDSTDYNYELNFSESCYYTYALLTEEMINSSSIYDYNSCKAWVGQNPTLGGTSESSLKKIQTGTFANLVADTAYTLVVFMKVPRQDWSGVAGNTVKTGQNCAAVKFTASKKKVTVPSETKMIRLDTTTETFDVKAMLINAGIPESDLTDVSYAATKGNGTILSGNPTVNAEGMMTLNMNAALPENKEEEVSITVAIPGYEMISTTLTLQTTNKTTLTLSGVTAQSNIVYDGTAKTGYTGTIQWTDGSGNSLAGEAQTDIVYKNASGTVLSGVPTAAGSYSVSFTIQSDNTEYAGTGSVSFTIQKATITSDDMSSMAWYIDGTKITSDSYTMTEDGSSHTVELRDISDKVTATTDTVFTQSEPGSYVATVRFQAKDTANYTLPTELSVATFNWSITEKAAEEDVDPTPVTYTVTFYSQGGSSVASITVSENETIRTLPTSTKSGYTFLGWYTAATGGTKVTSITVDSNKTLYAQWKQIETVTESKPSTDTTTDSDATTEQEQKPVASVGQETTDASGNKFIVTSATATTGTVEFTGGKDKNVAKVKIPATVTISNQQYQVTSIQKNAFSGYKKLSSVTIPSSVTSIGANAFKGCVKLTSITIPKSVTSIGSGAFSGCKKLKKVKLSANITQIPSNAFNGCTKLSSITIPTKVTKLGDKAFYKCTSLKKITIPKNVTTIGKSTFQGCKNLKTVTIKSKKLKKVGSKAISGIHKKATIKCPSKKYVKTYKKLFKSKTGYKKSMKIK